MLKFRVVIGLHNTDVDEFGGGTMVENPALPLDTSVYKSPLESGHGLQASAHNVYMINLQTARR